jgi:hypothetical protein
MSNKINSLTVVFDEDLSEEGAEQLAMAIRLMKNVISVDANVADPSHWVDFTRARHELRVKMWDILYPKD